MLTKGLALKSELTAARLRELLHYEPETGVFTRAMHRGGGRKVGDVAGSLDKKGYRVIAIDGRAYKAHRLAWLYMTDRWPAEQIDHRNRQRADNRWRNLREADNAQNQQNIGLRSNNSSGFHGVSWHRGQSKWCARITVDKRLRSIGYFRDPSEAGAAYAAAKRALHTFATESRIT